MSETRYTQHPADALVWTANFEPHLERRWEADTDYASTTRVRPPIPNGYEYECTTAGRTGASAPRWPTTVAATITDGSAVWTCRAISTAGLKTTLSTALWTVDTGLTVASQAVSGQRATAKLGPGTDGQDYRVVVKGTMADATVVNIVWRVEVRTREVS